MPGSFERSKQWTQLNILMLIMTILRLLPGVRGQAERAEDKSLSTRSQIRQKALAELDEQLQDLYSARDFAYGATGPESLFSAANHDWELRDIALVLTVDGELHAVKRSTGQHVWSLHDSSSGQDNIISQPLVAARSSYPNTSAVADHTTGQGLSSHANSSPPDQSDEVYILEPTAGGSIFVYSRSKQSTTKLPLTMAELVNLSPFTFPGDDSRMFVSQKTTSLVGVDLASGKLAGVFGPEAGWCEWQSNRNGMMDSDNEEGIQTRPRDLLYVGRTGEASLVLQCAATDRLCRVFTFNPRKEHRRPHPASILHLVPPFIDIFCLSASFLPTYTRRSILSAHVRRKSSLLPHRRNINAMGDSSAFRFARRWRLRHRIRSLTKPRSGSSATHAPQTT